MQQIVLITRFLEAFDIRSDSDYNDYFVISKNEGGRWLCEDCAKTHECGEEMLLPVCNSPRLGVCGYCGSNIYPDRFVPDM